MVEELVVEEEVAVYSSGRGAGSRGGSGGIQQWARSQWQQVLQSSVSRSVFEQNESLQA